MNRDDKTSYRMVSQYRMDLDLSKYSKFSYHTVNQYLLRSKQADDELKSERTDKRD